jgi:hypothetical protein
MITQNSTYGGIIGSNTGVVAMLIFDVYGQREV